MAKRSTNKDTNLKFEQTEGKRYGRKKRVDVGSRVELTDISRPVPKQRKRANKSAITRKNTVKKPHIRPLVKRASTWAKKRLKAPKTPLSSLRRGIIGIGLASVIVSIAYSVVVIWSATDGLLPKIMLAPQAIFATILLCIACAKILK